MLYKTELKIYSNEIKIYPSKFKVRINGKLEFRLEEIHLVLKMSLKIFSGEKRGLKLHLPKNPTFRPTQAKVKEA
ncbi:MAG: RsmD family RNA methyltransferase, partial [Endomicrobium sp.]|nr:RsmD family RNA methyltransferase [Endomicrobium sp.]